MGENSGTIATSTSRGSSDVSVQAGGTINAGGLVGANDGAGSLVTDSYATGNVTVSTSTDFENTGSTVGGLVGANPGTVRGSYATGDVTALSEHEW